MVLLAMVGWCCACLGADHLLPLAPGVTWVYRGVTRWSVPKPPTYAAERVLTWRVKVLAAGYRGENWLALLEGFPTDLCWYEPGKTTPGRYLVIRTPRGGYYLSATDAHRLNLVTRKDVQALLTPGNLLLVEPLRKGLDYGMDPADPPRPDHWYRWHVEQAGRRQFHLAYRTCPDETLMTVAPGRGITAFTYVHHGTVAETHLRLIEYHSGT
jgi:hypothetical protein